MNGNEATDVRGDSRKRYRYRDKKMQTALRTNRIARFVTVSSEKK